LIVTLFINVFSFTFSFYESYWRTSATLPLNLHLVHLSVCLFVFLSICLSVILYLHCIFSVYASHRRAPLAILLHLHLVRHFLSFSLSVFLSMHHW
jgi:hypothetical protein